MKKTLAILLAAVMMLGMVACAAPAATEEAPAAEAPAAEAPAEEAPAEEAPAEEAAPAVADLKLGFILGSREHAFYCSIEEGINAAAAEMGFEAVVLESDLNGAIASERIENLVVEAATPSPCPSTIPPVAPLPSRLPTLKACPCSPLTAPPARPT